jgi:hypothetical protein
VVTESRRRASASGLQITYLKGGMATLEGLDLIEPAGGFGVTTCLWAFSNVDPALRVAALGRWRSFPAPNGRIAFEMRHPGGGLASYDVESEAGKSVFRWETLGQQSVASGR